jgi:hypothetical protein
MAQDRSPEMIRIAYYFGRYDAARLPSGSTVPPELAQFGISSRNQALELFRAGVGDGRDEVKFRGSINGDIRYIAKTLRAGNRPGVHRPAVALPIPRHPPQPVVRALRLR